MFACPEYLQRPPEAPFVTLPTHLKAKALVSTAGIIYGRFIIIPKVICYGRQEVD
jgi:hypothetical protein